MIRESPSKALSLQLCLPLAWLHHTPLAAWARVSGQAASMAVLHIGLSKEQGVFCVAENAHHNQARPITHPLPLTVRACQVPAF